MKPLNVFWFFASKGGAGKTLMSMCLHRAFFEIKYVDPAEMLLLDLNTQNKDMFNILRKSTTNEIESMETSVFGRNISMSIVRLSSNNLYLATPNSMIDVASYVLLPIKLAVALDVSGVIVDTNLNLSAFNTISVTSLKGIRSEISEMTSVGIDVRPLLFYIWATGSITRFAILHEQGLTYELEMLFDGISKLGSIFNIQPQVFSMKNLIVVVNSTLWIYNTIIILKTILKNFQDSLLETLRRRENMALFSFSRMAKDVILHASRITAEFLSSISGKKPRFKYMEPLYILSLYHLLFGNSENVLVDISKKVKIPDELKLLVEKLKMEKTLETVPANLYVVPPPDDVHNILPFIFSTHLLGPNDIRDILADDDALGLPYRLISDQAKSLAMYLEGYIKSREIAGTR